LPLISYGLLALGMLFLAVLPLVLFCILSMASQREAEVEMLAASLGDRLELAAGDPPGRNTGSPGKPGLPEARPLGPGFPLMIKDIH
jgi:hypothetical protein